MPASILPPEIVSYIFDLLVSDKKALRCCSLVCHEWQLLTRSILFKRIQILGRSFKERLLECLIYGSSIHSSYIRFLILNNFFEDEDDNAVTAHHIGLLVQNLPLLQSLELKNVPTTTTKPSGSQQGISMLTLEELKLVYDNVELEIVSDLLIQFASINHLVIECDDDEYTGLKDGQTSVLSSPQVSSLDLEVADLVALALSKLLEPALSTLKTLSIKPHDLTYGINGIAAVTRGTNLSLESFVVDLTRCLSDVGKYLHPNLF